MIYRLNFDKVKSHIPTLPIKGEGWCYPREHRREAKLQINWALKYLPFFISLFWCEMLCLVYSKSYVVD